MFRGFEQLSSAICWRVMTCSTCSTPDTRWLSNDLCAPIFTLCTFSFLHYAFSHFYIIHFPRRTTAANQSDVATNFLCDVNLTCANIFQWTRNGKGVQFHNVCNKHNKITDVCCGIRNASAKMMTKSFVKQKLQYCERIEELQDQILPLPWPCGRRDEPWQKPQQRTFHNCRSGQWRVMYYDGSHFTFWNEFSTEKKYLIVPSIMVFI